MNLFAEVGDTVCVSACSRFRVVRKRDGYVVEGQYKIYPKDTAKRLWQWTGGPYPLVGEAVAVMRQYERGH